MIPNQPPKPDIRRINAMLSQSPHYERYLARMRYPSVNWDSIIASLNSEFELGLDKKQQMVIATLYTAFHQVKRCRGNEFFIRPQDVDTDAQHSVLSVLEAIDCLDRSGIDMSLPHNRVMRQRVAIKLLLHDLGELWGELLSNAESAQDVSVKKDQKDWLEGMVFEDALRRAIEAVYHPVQGGERNDVVAFLTRQQALINVDQHGANAVDAVQQALINLRDTPHRRLGTAALKTQETFLKLYKEVESKQGFEDCYAKTVEKLQGHKWIMQHVKYIASHTGIGALTKEERPDFVAQLTQSDDGIIPYTIAYSAFVRQMTNGMFKHIPSMWKLAAKYDQAHPKVDDEEMAITKTVIKDSYDLLIASADILPPVIDALKKQANPTEEEKELWHDKERFTAYRVNKYANQQLPNLRLQDERLPTDWIRRGGEPEMTMLRMFGQRGAEKRHYRTQLELRMLAHVCRDLLIVPGMIGTANHQMREAENGEKPTNPFDYTADTLPSYFVSAHDGGSFCSLDEFTRALYAERSRLSLHRGPASRDGGMQL